MMDPSFHKSVTTRRSYKYSYYYSAPTAGKPVLLFLHGFPCTSYDWRYQVGYFRAQGYGLIVPDLLGYGGTDKPTDPAQYLLRLMSQDVIDILDAENVSRAIAIGHDWGCGLLSRLANYYADRFIAFSFLAVGYVPPSDKGFEDNLALGKKLAGYELFGYWPFFAENGAHKIIEKNFDSFYSLLLAEDEKLWKSHLAPIGALKAWVEADKKVSLAPYVSKEEINIQKELLLRGGLEAPLCWYKVSVSGMDAEDGKGIAPENIPIQQPVFFGGALRDTVCLAAIGKVTAAQFCKGPLTIREFDAGHWVMWEEKDTVNQELLKWIQGL